ncbi:hypothetical protein TYRP_015909 [Tyrophagus putrescentiae]|nr:hypothetical protein TYRP_015909 [Tyrophagus putrescentiae]
MSRKVFFLLNNCCQNALLIVILEATYEFRFVNFHPSCCGQNFKHGRSVDGRWNRDCIELGIDELICLSVQLGKLLTEAVDKLIKALRLGVQQSSEKIMMRKQ